MHLMQKQIRTKICKKDLGTHWKERWWHDTMQRTTREWTCRTPPNEGCQCQHWHAMISEREILGHQEKVWLNQTPYSLWFTSVSNLLPNRCVPYPTPLLSNNRCSCYSEAKRGPLLPTVLLKILFWDCCCHLQPLPISGITDVMAPPRQHDASEFCSFKATTFSDFLINSLFLWEGRSQNSILIKIIICGLAARDFISAVLELYIRSCIECSIYLNTDSGAGRTAASEQQDRSAAKIALVPAWVPT